ncbi:hypothetical protein EG329_002225 [Mollisiaceae sp. DMI_Dod_QoI]|nr:hypothetical protein EG329_002225 [Helotiales sp. DMI_Dod_QoI]
MFSSPAASVSPSSISPPATSTAPTAPLLPSTYHFFGDLYLPEPAGMLSDTRLRRLEELRPILDLFDSLVFQNADFDLVTKWKDFKAAECSLWTREGTRDPRLLVRPSGSINAPVAIHLHYPSRKTSYLYNGEIADPSSGCPNRVINAGFNSQNSFWWNTHPWREDSVFDPDKSYSATILKSHHRWQDLLRSNMPPKLKSASENQINDTF